MGAELPRPDEATDFLAPASLADAHPRWTAEHRAESAVLGDLLVWPALSAGAIFDSNPFHQHGAHRSALGVDLSPQLLAERDGGLHRTDVYAGGDVRLYPDAAAADAAEGRAGLLHDWFVQPDLTVRLQGEIARRTDPFDTELVTTNGNRGLIYETDALAAGSVQKTFDRLFVSLSGTVLRANFSPASGARAKVGALNLSSETVGTVKARVGYLFPSSVYVFAEPAANWRSLDRGPSASDGARTVVGLGVARFGLLGGEAFAGLQSQNYPAPHRNEDIPVAGGRLGWSPHRAWSVTAQVDESLGQVAVGTLADSLGTPTRTRTALASVAHTLSPLWTARVEAGATWIDYVGTSRADRLTFADLRIDYALSRSFGLTGLLQISTLQSSIAAASYGRTAATLAATYRY